MNVFNNEIKLDRKTKDPQTDNALPPSGSLDWSKIGEKDAFKGVDGKVAGATGVDCKLIHGDFWEDVAGEKKVVVTKDETRHVMENRETTIGEDETFTIIGDFNETVTGEHMTLNVGEKTEVHMNANMKEKVNETLETHWNTEIVLKQWIVEVAVGKAEAIGMLGAVHLVKVEGVGLLMEGLGVKLGVSGFDNEIHGLESEIKAMESHIGALDTKVKAIRTGPVINLYAGLVVAANSVCM